MKKRIKDGTIAQLRDFGGESENVRRIDGGDLRFLVVPFLVLILSEMGE